MSVAVGSTVAPFTIVLLTTSIGIAVFATVRRAVRRGALLMRSALVIRDGHAALSDAARANLEKRGIDVAKMERLVDKTYTVNERGEIVTRGESPEKGLPSPSTSRTTPAAAAADRALYRKPSVEDLIGTRPGK